MAWVEWGTRVRNLGRVEKEFCPCCDGKRSFNLFFTYKYMGLYGVFNFCQERKLQLLCDDCGQGREFDHKERPDIDTIPIDFFDRLGCLIPIGVVALLLFFFWLSTVWQMY